MNILVLGRGGREHAIAKSLQSCSSFQHVFVAPGNDGIKKEFPTLNPLSLDPNGLILLLKRENIHHVVVGPEDLLVQGIADVLMSENITVLGVSKNAARLESDKIFAKQWMLKHHLPTATGKYFSKHPSNSLPQFGTLEDAHEYLKSCKYPQVIKASGLAAGKGVVITHNEKESFEALEYIFSLGDASTTFLIEDFLQGVECSLLALCDGSACFTFPISQDHKAVYDNDFGPNTGGMGAYAPIPWVDESLKKKLETRIIQPFLESLKRESLPYKGFIYFGLMLVHGDPYILEFNVRLGDPETQVILPLLKTDWKDLLDAFAMNQLHQIIPEYTNTYAVSLVLASEGYPGTYKRSDMISGLESFPQSPNLYPIYCGVKEKEGKLYTDGGRVMNLVSIGATLPVALENLYRSVDFVHFHGMHYRKDIARKGIQSPIW